MGFCMFSAQTIKDVIQRIAKVANPKKIFVFGSYARGDARGNSDIDLLVVEDTVKNRRAEMVRLHDAVRFMKLPIDILVVSEQAFNEWSNVPGTVIYKAKNEGVLSYETA